MAFSFTTHFLYFLIMLVFAPNLNPTQAIRPESNPTDTEFIKTSCKVATFPDLCYHSLSTYASDIQASPKLLANTALSVTIASTQTALDTVSKLSKAHGMLSRDGEAIRDCLEVLGDAVEELQKSITKMGKIENNKKFEFMINDIQTWVSAALTNEDTCMQGFEEKGIFGKTKNIIRGNIVNVCHLTSNALALVNNYASLHS
ncbi:hypothetical protein RND81_14G127000 [Saponaria officinalis]|uniref:Pectinesterase inhibitor domain-containing protein n=1 Tax=Saponaria officinalis TaxID=3572 RepID=A0AAW1GLQ5_SAPOF